MEWTHDIFFGDEVMWIDWTTQNPPIGVRVREREVREHRCAPS